MWHEFWNDARTPGHGAGPYSWATIAAGHYLIGTGLMETGLFPGWFCVLVYFTGKELFDWKIRGGSLVDGLIDTLFFALGVAQAPILALAGIATGISFYARLRRL